MRSRRLSGSCWWLSVVSLFCCLHLTFFTSVYTLSNDTCTFTVSNWNNYHSVGVFFINILKSNPDVSCIVWVVADTPVPMSSSREEILSRLVDTVRSKLRVVTTSDLYSLPQSNRTRYYIDELAFKYTPTEFAMVLKPLAFLYLFEVLYANAAVYLDTDVWVASSYREVVEIMTVHQRSVVLTVLSAEPFPEDGAYQKDLNVLRTGINSGSFIAFKHSHTALRYLHWWFGQISHFGYKDYSKGMHFDRIWHEILCALMDHHDFYISRDPRHNFGYWTLHYTQERVKMVGDVPHFADQPIVFLHMESITALSTDLEYINPNQDRYSLTSLSKGAQDVYRSYTDMLRSMEPAPEQRLPTIFYGYSRFNDGSFVSKIYKDYFKEVIDEHDALHPRVFTTSPEAGELFLSNGLNKDPFAVGLPGKRDIFSWLLDGPYEMIVDFKGKHFFTELEFMAYKSSRRLQNKFVFPLDRDYWAFKEHFLEHAVGLYGVSRQLMKLWVADFKANLLRALKLPSVELGINVLGWHKGMFGVGISARCMFDTLKVVNAPVRAVRIYGAREHKHKSTYIKAQDYTRSAESPINIVVANADNVPGILQTYPEKIWEEHYNIGVWAWELSIYPDKFMVNMKHFDELWLPTTFIKDAVASSPLCLKNVSLTVFPFGYPDANFASDENILFIREEFVLKGQYTKGNLLQIPLSTFVFLVVFDYYSYFDRKNPLGAVRAFKEAFNSTSSSEGAEDIMMLIKLNNRNFHFVSEHTDLMRAIDEDPRIVIVDGHLSDTEIEHLHSRSDVYVSLHRSEGFGLNILHAMAAGKITIATDYSGNADFFRKQEVRDAHFPIPVNLIPVKGTYAFAPYNWVHGAVWADPIHSAAVAAMKTAYSLDLSEHRQKMIIACQSLREDFGDVAVGHRMLQHLENLSPYKEKVLRKNKIRPFTFYKIKKSLTKLRNINIDDADIANEVFEKSALINSTSSDKHYYLSSYVEVEREKPVLDIDD